MPVTILIGIVAMSDMISYFNNPTSFMLGSEAMVSNGGMKYKSETNFLVVNLIHIFASLLVLFFMIKVKHKNVVFISLLIIFSKYL